MISIPFLSKKRSYNINPRVLIVLDGFGIAPPSKGNAITTAGTPKLDFYAQHFPFGQLIASGESVGLPANEDGNSEVGHLTMGAGRTVDQSLVRINKSIEDLSFYENKAFHDALVHVKKYKSKLHIMGLLSEGSVHSAENHLYALIEFCSINKLTNVCFHLFTDGRDALPTQGLAVIQKAEAKLKEEGVGRICTVAGRYYAMDRDARWERTKLSYDAIVSGVAPRAKSASQAVQASYDHALTDEFVLPTVIEGETAGTVENNDAVIFFNFRIDRPRQLTMAFVVPDFENMKQVEFGYLPDTMRGGEEKSSPTFTRDKKLANLFFVTMTEYQKGLPVSAIAFPPPTVPDSLPEVLSKQGMKQLHLAESEKERMVTFYFDGLKEENVPGEDVKIVPSPRIGTYDKRPAMNAKGIVKEFKKALKKDMYHFYVINFANPDMVAHSGNFDATVKAIKVIDDAVGEIIEHVLEANGSVFITADHGNAEELLNFNRTNFYFTSEKGKKDTKHSNNPVPIYIIDNSLRVSEDNKGNRSGINFNINGALCDVAPTILAMMGIPKPAVMTGTTLLGEHTPTGAQKQPAKG